MCRYAWTLNKNLAWQLSLRRVTSPVLKHIFWRHLGKDATAYVAKHQQWWEMCACVCNSIWTRMNKLVRHLEDSCKHLCEQWPNILFDNALWSGWMRTLVHGPQGSDTHGATFSNPIHVLTILVVKPEPPFSEQERHVAHLLIVQAPLPRERAVLMIAIYFSHREIATQHHARFTPSQLALTEATDLAEIPLSVRHRDITGMYGWRLLLDAPHQPLDILNGACLCITVHPPEENPPRGSTDEADTSFVRDRSRTPRRSFDDDDEHALLAHQGSPRPFQPWNILATLQHFAMS